MKIRTATDLMKLALVGGVVYVGYRAITALGDVPNATETVTNAYWRSSFGDLTGYAMDWYTNGWGDSWEYNGPSASLDDVQERFNNGGFSTL